MATPPNITESSRENDQPAPSNQSGSGGSYVPASTANGSQSTPTPKSSKDVSEPEIPEPDIRITYNDNGEPILSPEEALLGTRSLFVGDSICRGFAAYNVLQPENVFAAGNIGARNLFDIQVYQNGKEQKYCPVLQKLRPQNIFLWMGMNDVNMTEADEYCENYKKIIDLSLENSNAEIYICAISPIHSKFTPRSRITEFNSAIKEYIEKNYKSRVDFIDFTDVLKDQSGELKDEYNSGDGIHLREEAYFAIMRKIYNTLD